MAVLSNAGDHAPVIPLVETAFNGLTITEPIQIGLIATKVGVTFGSIVMVIVAFNAH